MKILVCGGRDYHDQTTVNWTLDAYYAMNSDLEIIEGGAPGADRLAQVWAKARGAKCTTVEADWRGHGTSAGPLRNKAMLALKPDLVVAFPGGRGTAHMVKIAVAAGVRVEKIAGKQT